MRIDPPCKVTREQITFDVAEIEPMLQAPPLDLKPWPGATITLKDGRILYIREAKIEEAPVMRDYVKRIMEAEHDFYDIVGARVVAEIIGWYRKRLKDPYQLVGLIDGVWAGFANGRLISQDINVSLTYNGIPARWPYWRSHVLRESILRIRNAGQYRMVGNI